MPVLAVRVVQVGESFPCIDGEDSTEAVGSHLLIPFFGRILPCSTSNDSAQSTMTMTKSDHDSAQEAGAQATSPSSSTSASGNDKRMVSSLLLGTAVMLGITFGLA